MIVLKSEKEENILHELYWHVVGEWNVEIYSEKINTAIFSSVLIAFKDSFKWLDVYEVDIWEESQGSVLPYWKKGSKPVDDWLKEMAGNENTKNYNCLAFNYNCFVDTSQSQNTLCEWENGFGYANASYKNSCINFSFCFYINLFTPGAYIFNKNHKEYLDIGESCRDHNKRCLSEAMEQFLQLTKGKVVSKYTESNPYISLNGFD